jgi:hypothetical protein
MHSRIRVPIKMTVLSMNITHNESIELSYINYKSIQYYY